MTSHIIDGRMSAAIWDHKGTWSHELIKGVVFDIQYNAIFDGPGIRMAFFLRAALCAAGGAIIPNPGNRKLRWHITVIPAKAVTNVLKLAKQLLAKNIATKFSAPKPIPPARILLDLEMKLRSRRQTDLPDYEFWAGADFDVTRLIKEDCMPLLQMEQSLDEHIRSKGETPLALVFKGNWQIALKLLQDGNHAKEYYNKALELDPNFTPAKRNLFMMEMLLR